MYFGVGGGYGFEYCKKKYGGIIPGLGCSLGPSYSRTWTTHFLTVDGMIGYEFRRDKRFKPFLELGLSQPVVYLNDKNHKNWNPAITLSLGLGW